MRQCVASAFVGPSIGGLARERLRIQRASSPRLEGTWNRPVLVADFGTNRDFAFAECRAAIRRLPSEQLKEFYYDTVNFDPKALRLAVEFAGPEHILAGSDYPHQIGSLSKMIESLHATDLSPEDRDQITSGNAARLLGLTV